MPQLAWGSPPSFPGLQGTEITVRCYHTPLQSVILNPRPKVAVLLLSGTGKHYKILMRESNLCPWVNLIYCLLLPELQAAEIQVSQQMPSELLRGQKNFWSTQVSLILTEARQDVNGQIQTLW